MNRRFLATVLLMTSGGSALGAVADGTAENPSEMEQKKILYIDEFSIDGNTALDQSTIEQAVYPFLGPDRTADDIDKAKDALEKAYRDKGFQTVQLSVPNPEPDDGVVHIKVTELTVGRLRVVGSRYYSLSAIKAQAPSMQEGKVPNFQDLSNDVAALNELPGREVTPTLKAGKLPGTIDVDLVVKDQLPLHAELDINNQQSLSTTPLRLNGTLSYDNLWQLGHRLSLAFQTAPLNPDDAKVFSGTYLARFIGSPFSLQLNAIVSDSNVSTLGSTDVIGNGTIIGIRGLFELPGADGFSNSIQAGLNYKDFKQATTVSGAAASQSTVPVTYVPLVASYSASLKEGDAVDSVNANVSIALARAGSSLARFDADRYDARGQELYFRGSWERLQDLPFDFRMHGRIEGQLTDEPLISNDQFPLGGFRSVRGYYESEVLVDTGFSGTLEVISPSLPALAKSLFDSTDFADSLTFVGFLDGGQGHILSALPQQHANFSLASYGFGADAALFGRVQGSLDVAIPLITTQNTRAGSQTILFRVATEY